MGLRRLLQSMDGVVLAFMAALTTATVLPIIAAPIIGARMVWLIAPHTLTAATITIHGVALPLGVMDRVVRQATMAVQHLGTTGRAVQQATAAVLHLGITDRVVRQVTVAVQHLGVGAQVLGTALVGAQDPSAADFHLPELFVPAVEAYPRFCAL